MLNLKVETKAAYRCSGQLQTWGLEGFSGSPHLLVFHFLE